MTTRQVATPDAGSPVPAVEALILAAGRGERLGLGDKAFVKLGGVTLLERAVGLCASAGLPVIVAVPEGREAEAAALCPPGSTVVAGGPTRSGSLRALLAASSAPVVLVHDIGHALAGSETMAAVIATTARLGGRDGAAAAIAGLRPADYVYRDLRREGDTSGSFVERVRDAWIAQSPRAFAREVLVAAYAALDAGRARGDSALAGPRWDDPGSIDLVDLVGGRVIVVPGDTRNIKITTAQDLRLAEALVGLEAAGRKG